MNSYEIKKLMEIDLSMFTFVSSTIIGIISIIGAIFCIGNKNNIFKTDDMAVSFSIFFRIQAIIGLFLFFYLFYWGFYFTSNLNSYYRLLSIVIGLIVGVIYLVSIKIEKKFNHNKSYIHIDILKKKIKVAIYILTYLNSAVGSFFLSAISCHILAILTI